MLKYILFFIINFKILSRCCNYVNKNEYYNEKDDKKKEIEDEKNDKKINKSELDKLDEKYKKDVDYKYLSENLSKIKHLKQYIDIKNLFSDEIPDISNIKDITTEDILNFLNVNEAQNEINKCDNINEKIKKLAEIIEDDYKNNRFTFENSNLLVPRCLIVHENNNCILEAYFSYLESNPYYCKFFWILNNLFENDNLNKNNLSITYEICQFFKNAINNPNFNDKVYCLNISKTWYDNVEKLKDKMDSNLKKGIEDYLKEHHFGGFQSNWYPYYLIESVILELKDYYDFNFYRNESENENNEKHYIFDFNTINYYVNRCIDINEINKQNCKDYLFKSEDKNTITGQIFCAVGWHFYTIRNINGVFFNYDSLKYDRPKVISYKDFMKIWLNYCKILKNFNGNYNNYTIICLYCFDEKYI